MHFNLLYTFKAILLIKIKFPGMFQPYQIYCIWHSQTCTLSKLLQKNFKTIPVCACIMCFAIHLVVPALPSHPNQASIKTHVTFNALSQLGALSPYNHNSNKISPEEKHTFLWTSKSKNFIVFLTYIIY